MGKEGCQIAEQSKIICLENINKWLNFILETCEINTSLRNMSQKIATFMEYFQKDLEHDELFYKKYLNNFVAQVSSVGIIVIDVK